MFIEWTLQESSGSPSYLSDIVLYYLHDINWSLKLLKIFFLWSILNSPSIKFSFKCLCYLIWSILSLFPYHLTEFWTCKCREYFYPRVSIWSILEFFPVANKKWFKVFLFTLTWPHKNFIECISFQYRRTIIVWHSYFTRVNGIFNSQAIFWTPGLSSYHHWIFLPGRRRRLILVRL